LLAAVESSILRSGRQVVLGLASQRRKIVAPQPACREDSPSSLNSRTTRDAGRQTIQVEGVPVNIIDTAVCEILRQGSGNRIARTWEGSASRCTLLVGDARTGVTAATGANRRPAAGETEAGYGVHKIDLSVIGRGGGGRTVGAFCFARP